MLERALIATVALGVVLAVAWWYRRHRSISPDPAALPPVPANLRGGASRTWLLFTTPLCASCGPLEETLRDQPDSDVVRIDATVQTGLAERYQVRRAPTVVLAGRDGSVEQAFVGPESVLRFLER